MSSEESEAALWGEAQLGDDQAFRKIYLRHADRIFTYALRRLRSIEDSEDVVVETFTALWAQRGAVTCDPDRGLLPWLFTVAKRTAQKLAHQHRRRPVSVGDLGHGVEENPQLQPGVEIYDELVDLIAVLPDEDRTLASLSWIWGYTSIEIGQIIDMPGSTVRWRLARLRKNLDRQMHGLEGPLT